MHPTSPVTVFRYDVISNGTVTAREARGWSVIATARYSLRSQKPIRCGTVGALVSPTPGGAAVIRRVLANCTVSDLDRAERWYANLFEREPDARPMTGLIEWHFSDACGVQVWSEPERAGRSTVVLEETDLDAVAARAAAAGIDHSGPQPGGGARILQLSDPEGNRVVFTGV